LASVLDNRQRSVIEAMTKIDLAVTAYPFARAPRILQGDVRRVMIEANKR